MLGHDRQIKRTTLEATCTAPGTAEEACLRTGCAEPDMVELVLPALGHNLTLSTIQSPTCSTSGKGRETCTRKGCTLPAKEVSLSVLSHTIEKTLIPPFLLVSRCVEDQLVIENCIMCSYSNRYTIHKTGHNWVISSFGYKCSNCGMWSLLNI